MFSLRSKLSLNSHKQHNNFLLFRPPFFRLLAKHPKLEKFSIFPFYSPSKRGSLLLCRLELLVSEVNELGS